MAIFLANFEMRAGGHDYVGLFNHLRHSGAQQALSTAWLIESSEPVKLLSDRLLVLMAPGDGLFILEVTETSAWAATRLDREAGPWLKSRRP